MEDANIVTALQPGEVNAVGGGVRLRDGLGSGGSTGDHGEHAPSRPSMPSPWWDDSG